MSNYYQLNSVQLWSKLKEFIAQIKVFVNKEYSALPYSRMSSKYAHNIDLWIFVLFLIVVSKDSHLYNQKPESNGHIKYIGRRRLNKLRNQGFCFFFSHPVVQDENELQLIWTFFQLYWFSFEEKMRIMFDFLKCVFF